MSEIDTTVDDQAVDTSAQGTQVDNTDDIASQLELEPETPETPAEPEKVEEEETETPESPEEKPDDPEKELPEKPEETEAERNRRFYELRQQNKQQVERAIDQNYQPQPVDQLTQHFMEQGYDQFQASMLARDEVRAQREQISEARAQIAELNMTVETEAVQVMHDFPVFDPKSKEYDPDFANMASQLYKQSANPVVDPNTGVLVQTNMTPYAFYKQLADMRSSGTTKAQVKAQEAVTKQMASVTPAASSAPSTTPTKEEKEATDLEAALNAVK